MSIKIIYALLFVCPILGFAQGNFSTDRKVNRAFEKAERTYKSQNFDKALKRFKDANQEFEQKNISETQYLLGNIEYGLKNYKEARIAYFNFVKSLEPTDPRKSLGQVCISRCTEQMARLKKLEEAKKKAENEKDKKPTEEIEDFTTYKIKERNAIYPGCENFKNSKDLKDCFQRAVTFIVMNAFDRKVVTSVGLQGSDKISVRFVINREGNISNIDAVGSHPLIEIEAIRVMQLIPQVQPAIQRDNPVGISYGLPIIF